MKKYIYIGLIIIIGIMGLYYFKSGEVLFSQNLDVLNNNYDGKIIASEKINVTGESKKIDKLNFYTITYLSGDQKAEAFMIKPKSKGNYPVVLFNRYGAINNKPDGWVSWFTGLASKNYIIIAPRYKNVEWKEHSLENFAVNDTKQFLDLFPLIKSLPFADEDKIVSYGEKRGGLLTYQAIKHDMGLKAAAVYGVPSDLILSYNNSIHGRKKIYENEFGGSPEEVKEKYIDKSPYYWANEIDIPILIMHSTKEKSIETIQADKLVEQFEKIGKSDYKAVINSEIDPIFMFNNAFAWFKNKANFPCEEKIIER